MSCPACGDSMTCPECRVNRSGILFARVVRRLGHRAPGIVGEEDFPPEWGIWRRDPYNDGEGGEQ
jgi:hypothetical protein